MIEESNREVDFRLRGYDRQNYDYTSARYSLPSMKFYSNLRSIKISKLMSSNIILDMRNIIEKDNQKLSDFKYYGLGS